MSDHLGSTSVVTNSAGAVTGRRLYKPWGENRGPAGSLPTPFGYTGQREEAALGLSFYNARWYDPALGRFIQADTLVPQPGNPLAWDRFAYAWNNPVMYADPSGHASQHLFAGDGDVWKPPLSSYGVTLSGDWTVEDEAQIAAELQMISNTLVSSCPNGNCFGMAPHEVFYKTFEETTISLLEDGEDLGCAAGNPIECSEGTLDQLKEYDQDGLIIHEFGHNFDHKIKWGLGRITLAASTIAVNGVHISGYNPTTGRFERTELGYRSDDYPDVQHPIHMDEAGRSSGEDFADMFLNLVRDSFSDDVYGDARKNWMTGMMNSWMNTISSGW